MCFTIGKFQHDLNIKWLNEIIVNFLENTLVMMWSRHAQSCLTLCDPMDCSTPGSSVHGIFQARILKWVAISSSRGSFRPKDQAHISCVSCIADEFPTPWALLVI